jgi:hypothetical protein
MTDAMNFLLQIIRNHFLLQLKKAEKKKKIILAALCSLRFSLITPDTPLVN